MLLDKFDLKLFGLCILYTVPRVSLATTQSHFRAKTEVWGKKITQTGQRRIPLCIPVEPQEVRKKDQHANDCPLLVIHFNYSIFPHKKMKK